VEQTWRRQSSRPRGLACWSKGEKIGKKTARRDIPNFDSLMSQGSSGPVNPGLASAKMINSISLAPSIQGGGQFEIFA
jgi:hypothetical protein